MLIRPTSNVTVTRFASRPPAPEPREESLDTVELSAPRRRRLGRALGALALSGALLIGAGNLAILGAHLHQQAENPQPETGAQVVDVENFYRVDERVWRGDAPSSESYADLADAGVTTIVDLRAEKDVSVDTQALAELGLSYEHIPIRDGQPPSDSEVDRFLAIVDDSEGTVFLHCGAGVGRTGSMAAAYMVATGQAEPEEALEDMLSVGPPSLEQIMFVRSLDDEGHGDVNPVVLTVSRVLDGPRRLWSYVD